MKQFSRVFGLSMMLVLVLSVVGAVTAQDDGIFIVDTEAVGASDIPTLDPALTSDTASVTVVANTYVTLTLIDDQTFEVKPGMAESWEYDEETRTYTFSLMSGVPWVEFDPAVGEVVEVLDENGDVRMVTASDFEYGITRTLSPEAAAPYQYVLSPWVDGLEFEDGAVASIDGAMVEAVDDTTLTVTVPKEVAGVGFIPSIFGLWFTAAQPQWIIEEAGDAWIEAENHQSYGPFAVSEWLHDESLTMVKNPFWPGVEAMPQATVDGVQLIVADTSVSLAQFEAGQADIAQVPTQDIDRILSDPELSEAFYVAPGTCTYYYGFNIEKAPFDDVRVRRAFSQAINRQSLSDNVLRGGQPPAGFFARPDLAAAPSQALTPDQGIYTDAEAAQAELQEYLDENGLTVDDLPPITLMHNENELHASVAEAIQQMWSETLGVEINITTQEWGVYLDTLRTDAPQVYRIAWCLDYPDANNFLYDVFHSTSENNYTNWTNERFDALLEEARLLTDNEARQALYTEADNILVAEDAAIAPIYYYTTLRMFSDRFEFTPSKIGHQIYSKWVPAQ